MKKTKPIYKKDKDDLFNLRINSKIKEAFLKAAKKQNTNGSSVLLACVNRYLKNHP